jgi:hypothetical protein
MSADESGSSYIGFIDRPTDVRHGRSGVTRRSAACQDCFDEECTPG